jgi:hypothetical protein
MIRLSFGIVFLLTTCFTFAIAAFRVQTPNTFPEAEIGRCATPCWQGIQPGITTKQVAVNQLTSANGFDPVSPECYSPSMLACELYQWPSPENVRIWTGIQTQRGIVVNVDAKAPGFTLGEALLSLKNLHHGLYSFQLGHNLDWMYLWLSFSDASISVSAQSTCPTSFFAMMQTPIDTVAIQSPNRNRLHEPMTFGGLRRLFADLCEQ